MSKETLKKNYKENGYPMGVNIITNIVNGKIFIGKGKNLQGRINRHKFELKFGSEENKELLKDFKLFGEENFKFEILDTLKPKEDAAYDYTDDLECLEALYLEKLTPYNELGYNIEKKEIK